MPYAVGHAEKVEGSPFIFPAEEILKDAEQRNPRARCDLKPERGPCKGIFWEYYFNPKTKKCEKFAYGGCGGVVPFETKEECEELFEKQER